MMDVFKRALLKVSFVLAGMSCGAAMAQMTYVLEHSGDVDATQFDTFTDLGRVFNRGSLALFESGANTLPFTVVQGDSIDVTVTLTNGPFVVPASPEQFFGLNFESALGQLPGYDMSLGAPQVVVGSLQFYLAGDPVGSQASGSCGNCPTLLIFSGPGASISFDRIEASLTFTNLLSPYTIDRLTMSYQLSAPVPEPASLGLMVAGLGAIGLLGRRQRRGDAALPTLH